MKTAEVRILPAPDAEDSPGEETFLFVETMSSPQGEETRIDRVSRRITSAGHGNLTKDAVATSLTATHKVAVEWAAAFAALNGIPVVYERRKEDR